MHDGDAMHKAITKLSVWQVIFCLIMDLKYMLHIVHNECVITTLLYWTVDHDLIN